MNLLRSRGSRVQAHPKPRNGQNFHPKIVSHSAGKRTESSRADTDLCNISVLQVNALPWSCIVAAACYLAVATAVTTFTACRDLFLAVTPGGGGGDPSAALCSLNIFRITSCATWVAAAFAA